MYRILSTGKSALAAFQEQLDQISNNIANTQTDGYRTVNTRFESLLSDEINNNGVPLSDELKNSTARIGIGAKTTQSYRSEEQGALVAVEDHFALAIQGEGYFGIRNDQDELLLTRSGNFNLSEDGQLVDPQGNHLEIEYSKKYDELSESAEVSDDGKIYERSEDGDRYKVGEIHLYQPQRYSVIVENGQGYFMAEDLMEVDFEDSETMIRQSYIEKSNVDIGDQLVEMLKTQRAYELSTRSLRAADDMWSMANNLRR